MTFPLCVYWGHLNIRIFMLAKELQAFDLLHIASGAFSGLGEALVRNRNRLISFIVRCRYRTF
jgi:hypothetical protein